MTEYDKFLQRVNKSLALKEGIDVIKEEMEEDFVNLTHIDWKDHLANDAVYQRYLNRQVSFTEHKLYDFVSTQYVSREEDYMKLVVVAQCIFIKEQTRVHKENRKEYTSPCFIAIKYCPPLQEVSRVCTLDVSKPGLILSPNTKLWLEKCCGPTICNDCRSYLQRADVDKSKADILPWMCISTTKVFNGHHVINVLGDIAMTMFTRGGQFWAVLKVTLNCRQFYSADFKTVKMSGCVNEMIIFPESSLSSVKPKKMRFLDSPPLVHRPLNVQSPATAMTPCSSSTNPEDTTTQHMTSSGVSFSLRAPGRDILKNNIRVEIDATEDKENIAEEKNICLPDTAKNAFLEQQKAQEEGGFDVQYEKVKF